MIPNWVFGAIPLAVLAIIAWLYDVCAFWREQRELKYIFDGDRLQARHVRRYHRYQSAGRRYF